MDLQKSIVVEVAQSVDDEWERIVINYEMQEEEGGVTEDRRGFYIARDGSGFRKASLAFSETAKELFRELAAAMAGQNGDRWSTCDLVIDQPGKFKYEFSYDPPKRINGVFDEQSMGRFDNYLPAYLAERQDRQP